MIADIITQTFPPRIIIIKKNINHGLKKKLYDCDDWNREKNFFFFFRFEHCFSSMFMGMYTTIGKTGDFAMLPVCLGLWL